MPLKQHATVGSEGARMGAGVPLGDEQYLWILVLVEVGILGGFRWATRKLHGG